MPNHSAVRRLLLRNQVLLARIMLLLRLPMALLRVMGRVPDPLSVRALLLECQAAAMQWRAAHFTRRVTRQGVGRPWLSLIEENCVQV